jgi:large subunit ribosomal protein L15
MADADKPDEISAADAQPEESAEGTDKAPAKGGDPGGRPPGPAQPRSRSRAKAAQAAGSAEAAGEAAEAAGKAAEAAEEAAEAAGKAADAAERAADEQQPAEPAAKAPARAPAKPRTRAKAGGEAPKEKEVSEPPAKTPAPDVPSGRAGLKLHHLRPAPGSRKERTRVGRGEASKGKTAGRGTKGTKARDKVPPRFEGGQMPLHRRVPKLKGFSNARFTTTYQVVNTGRLGELYPEGGEVTPDDLVARGAARKGELIKVLGTGDVGSALRVTAHAFSASAKEKITAAGGTVTEL